MFHKNTIVSFKDNAVSISNPDFTIARFLVFLLMVVSIFLLIALESSLLVGVYFSLGFLAFLPWIFMPFSCMIDASGIKAKSMVREKTLDWASVRDYGIAYSFHNRYGGRYYFLYFADSVLPDKRNEKKRFSGRVVKIQIDERAVLSKGPEIMAFCAQYTGVAPFIADPDNHTGWF